jgi:hypothetical protein
MPINTIEEASVEDVDVIEVSLDVDGVVHAHEDFIGECDCDCVLLE